MGFLSTLYIYLRKMVFLQKKILLFKDAVYILYIHIHRVYLCVNTYACTYEKRNGEMSHLGLQNMLDYINGPNSSFLFDSGPFLM